MFDIVLATLTFIICTTVGIEYETSLLCALALYFLCSLADIYENEVIS